MTWRDASSDGTSVTPIVLAAGGGSRFHDFGHKLTAPLPATADRPAETVFARAIAAAIDAGIGTVVVITGRLSARELDLPGLTADDTGDAPVEPVHNAAWEDGQMTSVQVGLAAARTRGSEVAVIGLADQPGITSAAWRAVAAACSADDPVVVAVYDGRRANPVALHRSVWGLLPLAGDEGARSLMRLRPDLVREVPCSGSPSDIDTEEDLRRWQNS